MLKDPQFYLILILRLLLSLLIHHQCKMNMLYKGRNLYKHVFSIGLYAICAFGLNLYTGKIGYVIDNKPKYLIELLFTLIGNLIGTIGCGYLLFLTRQGDKLSGVAGAISEVKLNDNLLSIFILAIFCGIIMYLAVDLYKRLGDFGKYMGIFMGITVFILAGFEHCVANMYYFSAANMWSWKTILYVFIMVLGNSTASGTGGQ